MIPGRSNMIPFHSRTFTQTVLTFTMLFLVLSAIAQAEQQVFIDKGMIVESTQRPVPSTGDCTATSEIEITMWELEGAWNQANGAIVCQSDATGSASMKLTLPTLNNIGGQLFLEFSEAYAFESGHDFGLVRVSTDSGATWIEVDRRSGSSIVKNSMVDLTSFAGQNIGIEFSNIRDESFDGNGWTVSDTRISTYSEKAATVSLVNINHGDFPYIFMNVAVRDDGVDVPDLNDDAFTVYEDDVLQTGSFDVVPPSEGGGVRVADIVFVLDVTGSMSDEIASVRTNMASFVNTLAASSIDYRIGFVRFWDTVEVMNDGNLYSNYSQIMATINSFTAGGGGDGPENPLEAMVEATRMNFRPGAHRVQIMLTDANAHESDWATPWTVATTIAQLQATGSLVYPVFNTGSSAQLLQYVPIADATNPDGDYYHIYNNFNGIITSIQESIALTYIVRYRTTNGVLDGAERQVRVAVDVFGDLQQATGSYIPGSAPVILRTEETIALSERSWAELTPISIAATVTDPIAPMTSSVTLFYRQMDASMFSSIPMIDESGGVYRANLPNGAVLRPGFRYYISATDGISVSTAPEFEPHLNAYTVGVLPNVLPAITFTPPAPQTLTPGTDVLLTATVVDETNALASVALRYKPVGEAIWNDLPMAPTSGDNFSATIPGERFPEEGVEVYLRAWDDVGSDTTYPATEPYLIRAWVSGANDLLVFKVDTRLNSAAVTSVRVLGDTDWGSPKAYHIIAEKALGDDGLVRFDVSDLSEMESQVDEEIRRIELMGGPGNIVGHLNFHYSSRNYNDHKKIEAFLFLHDDTGAPRINAANGAYAAFYTRHGGWEDYDPDDQEYLVSMLVPPEEQISNIDAGHRDPVVLVHGVYGYFPYWYNTDTRVHELNEASDRKGGLAFHLDGYDTWSFYYPYDILIDHASVLLGRALNTLLGPGGVAGTGEYDGNVAVVAHSMGGLVTRGWLNHPEYDGNMSKLLMYATPNHGSYSSFRMLYDGWSPTTGLADLFLKDRASPSHFDMTPGSAFLRDLDATPLRDLSTPGTGGDYLVVAGRDDINVVGFFHDEILSQDDGVVAVSSASLLDKDVPLVIVDHNHTDIYKQFRTGRTIEIADAFLGGGSSPDLGHLSSWYECLIEDLDDVGDCGTIRTDVGLLNLTLPGVAVGDFLINTVGDDSGRLNVIAEGRSIDNPIQKLMRIPATGTYFSFLDYFIATNEITWTPPERDFGVPSAGDGPYDLYFYRQGLFSPAAIGRVLNALPTRYVSTISETINLTEAAIDALNGRNGALLEAKALTRELVVDATMTNIVFVLNFEPETGTPAIAIEDPSGGVWQMTNVGLNPDMAMDLDPEAGIFVASVDNPDIGTWRLSYPEDLIPTAAEAFLDAEVLALLEVTSARELEPGADLEVRVELTSYWLLSDTDLEVALTYRSLTDDGEKMTGTIELEPVGGGTYSGSLTVQTKGLYELSLVMTGRSWAGDTLTRYDIDSFRVGRAASTLDLAPGEIAFYPNPLNPDTDSGVIAFDAPSASTYTLTIYDASGQVVMTHQLGHIESGPADTVWDGRDSRGDIVANGLYFGVVSGTSGDRLITKIAVLR